VAKKSKIARSKRTATLKVQYVDKRKVLTDIIKNPETSPSERLEAYRKLARLPRDSSPTRHRNRCELTGRPRAYYRKFRISRIMLRELALEGKLPGVTKSSW